MSYAVDLKAHLAHYKRSVLHVARDGSWAGNGRTYAHILPKKLRDLNLLPSVREQVKAYMSKEQIKRHSDFHHLNSSQAFAFNLFFPSLTDGALSRTALLQALGLRGDIYRWAFEAIRDRREGTNFDLWLDLREGGEAFLEVKLTESGFGEAKADERHREKRDRIYKDRLTGKVRSEALEGDAFFKHYQLLRNLSYVDPAAGRTLLLVFPRANIGTRQQAETFLRDIVAPSCRDSVRLVHAEDLVSRLYADQTLSPYVRAALESVGAKYALPVSSSISR